MTVESIRKLVRDVPDFPKPGVVFKDITPLLADPDGFSATIDLLAERIESARPESILAIESRGFIFGAALAARMHLPLHLIRKQGKLPWECVGVSYELEYGSDRIEMHTDAIESGLPYVIVDDVLATGGTAAAAVQLVEQQQGIVAACAFVIELEFLQGRKRLPGKRLECLLKY